MYAAYYTHGMSKRLQVLLADAEYRELQRMAHKRRMTVSTWVRYALELARGREPAYDAGRKVAVVREGARHAFPAGDVSQMLSEIERGYESGVGR